MTSPYLLRHLSVITAVLLSYSAVAEDSTVTMYLKGSSQTPSRGTAELAETPTHYFQNNPDAKIRGVYRSVYPGIDMTCVGDSYSTEYIFSLQPGADPNLISCFFKDSTLVSLLHSGSLQFRKDEIQIQVSQPVAYLQVNNETSMRYLKSRATTDGHVAILADELVKETQQKLNNTTVNLIPGGGQPNGPMHDFFISRFETVNDQLLFFLNDAEANQMNDRGSNMHFDERGNIWINRAMKMARDEMFAIANSKFTYDPEQPAGHRYDHVRGPDDHPLYADHPAMGLSWFGTIKYCNWLTLHSGRGTAQLCYSEGTNAVDWAPITATNWVAGSFTDLERYEWLKLKGFRLSSTGTNTPLLEANPFNELFKCAAWSSYTNHAFGSGMDDCDGTSANFKNTPFNTAAGSLPAGFFSEKNRHNFKDLTPSANFYGIYDLSGNAAEWTSDTRSTEVAVAGGSWSDPPMPINTCYYLPPYYTAKSVGMRAATTYMPDFNIHIHILVTFYFLEEGLPPLDIPDSVLQPYLKPDQPPPGAPITDDRPDGGAMAFTANQSDTDYITPGGIIYKSDTAQPIPPAGPPSSPTGDSTGTYIPGPIPDPDPSPSGI